MEEGKKFEKIENKGENSFETKNEFNLESIQEYYDSDPELKEKYIEDMIVHNQEKETILEVLVKNNGLNQKSIPTDEQYEALKFLSAGEYPNCRNVIHVAGAYGRDRREYEKIGKLDSKIGSSKLWVSGEYEDPSSINHSAFFCSPWNSWFVSGGSAHIFRPEDLSSFLNNLTNKFFKMDVDEFMSKKIKKILEDKFKKNNLKNIDTHGIDSSNWGRKYEKEARCNQSEKDQIKKIYKKETKYIYEPLFYPPNYENFLNKLEDLDKTKTIEKLKKPDKQGLINLILYSVPKYLKLISDKTEKEGFKFVDKDDISDIELKDQKLEEADWAYSSRDSWSAYGFLLFSEVKDINLKFGDASIILINHKAKPSDSTESDTQKVIFRFKK